MFVFAAAVYGSVQSGFFKRLVGIDQAAPGLFKDTTTAFEARLHAFWSVPPSFSREEVCLEDETPFECLRVSSWHPHQNRTFFQFIIDVYTQLMSDFDAGHYVENAELIDSVLDVTRKETEDHHLQGLQVWHSMTNCISVAYVAWVVVWAVWELYFYTVSQHQEWSLFKYCEEIETGRLKAEAWERALRGVVRSVVDGTCECDLEGIILRASPQFAELVGMEQFHLVGQSLSSLCLNAECDRVSTFIQQCVCGDQLAAAATIETILCGKPDGECLGLSLFVAQIPIANGALFAGVQLQGRGNKTCHDDPSDTDSATPTCSGGVYVAMSCGGGSFTPDGVHDSLWDSVKPMTGLRKCCSGACRRLALVVSTSVLHPTWQWITSTSGACLLSVTRLSQTNQTSSCDV